MNDGGVWTKESLDWLKANCQIKPHDMQDMLRDQFGVEPALQTIRNEVTKARREAREQGDAIAAEIDKQIQECVRDALEDYWGFQDSAIRRTARILDGEDPDYEIPLDSNEVLAKAGKKSNFYYIKYARLLGEQIEKAFAMRPESRELDVHIESNRDVEALLKEYSEVYEKE